jgi:hypothetical protein
VEDIQGIGNFRPGVLSFPSFTIINFFRLHMRLLHNNLLSGHFCRVCISKQEAYEISRIEKKEISMAKTAKTDPVNRAYNCIAY